MDEFEKDFMPKNEMRRVFKIPIGDIPEEEQEEYVRKIAEKFKAGEPLDDLKVEEIPCEDIFIPKRTDEEIKNDVQYFQEKRDFELDRLVDCIKRIDSDEIIQSRFNAVMRINKQLKLIEDAIIMHKIAQANKKQ